jgi:hypothetical protein
MIELHRARQGSIVLGSLFALVACGPVQPARDGAVGADTGSAMDVTSAADAGADAAMDARRGDGGGAGGEDAAAVDVVIDPGRCGQSVRDCLCGCGANATCQQGCVQGDPTCSDCLYEALTMCCPAENDAVERCIIESMCETDACILAQCGMQWNALQLCARRRESEPSCQMRTRACLGPDYPAIQCVRDE